MKRNEIQKMRHIYNTSKFQFFIMRIKIVSSWRSCLVKMRTRSCLRTNEVIFLHLMLLLCIAFLLNAYSILYRYVFLFVLQIFQLQFKNLFFIAFWKYIFCFGSNIFLLFNVFFSFHRNFSYIFISQNIQVISLLFSAFL